MYISIYMYVCVHWCTYIPSCACILNIRIFLRQGSMPGSADALLESIMAKPLDPSIFVKYTPLLFLFSATLEPRVESCNHL